MKNIEQQQHTHEKQNMANSSTTTSVPGVGLTATGTSRRYPGGSRPGNNAGLSIITLSRWQLHQTWRLLLVMGSGVLVAIVLICMVPLYSQVAMSAGLRDTIASSPGDSYVTVHSVANQVALQPIQDVQSRLTAVMQQNMGSFIKSS